MKMNPSVQPGLYVDKAWLRKCRRARLGCDVDLYAVSDLSESRLPICANKYTLQCESPYFSSEFGPSDTHLMVPGVQRKVLELLVDFIYSGDLDGLRITNQNVFDIWTGAHKLMLKKVQEACHRCIVTLPIEAENCVEILNYAHRHSSTSNLMETAIKFFMLNLVKIANRPEFIYLEYKILKRVLQNGIDSGYGSKNLMIMVFNWMKHKFEERKLLSMDLLASIPIKKINEDCLYHILRIDEELQNLYFDLRAFNYWASSALKNKEEAKGLDKMKIL